MTIHAYREIYLSKAKSVLGDAFDYAVNACDIPGDDFIKMFLVSSISSRMENGEPDCLVGKSGIEIVWEVVAETKDKPIHVQSWEQLSRSREYWIGWVVAHYQWHTGRSYREIFKAVSFGDLQSMYYTLHEADITKFIDIMNERIKVCFPETNLKRIRQTYGCTQVELAEVSGVSLRSIQMYEQRNKNINKASVESIYRLAKALGCSIEDLLEKA